MSDNSDNIDNSPLKSRVKTYLKIEGPEAIISSKVQAFYD